MPKPFMSCDQQLQKPGTSTSLYRMMQQLKLHCANMAIETAAQGWPEMFARHGQGGCQGYLPREYMFTCNTDRTIEPDRAYCFNPVIDGAKTEDAFLVTAGGIELITHPVHFDADPCRYKDRNV